MKKIEFIYRNTFSNQIEILPRFSIIYGKGVEDEDFEIIANGIAIEWLWFCLFIKIE